MTVLVTANGAFQFPFLAPLGEAFRVFVLMITRTVNGRGRYTNKRGCAVIGGSGIVSSPNTTSTTNSWSSVGIAGANMRVLCHSALDLHKRSARRGQTRSSTSDAKKIKLPKKPHGRGIFYSPLAARAAKAESVASMKSDMLQRKVEASNAIAQGPAAAAVVVKSGVINIAVPVQVSEQASKRKQKQLDKAKRQQQEEQEKQAHLTQLRTLLEMQLLQIAQQRQTKQEDQNSQDHLRACYSVPADTKVSANSLFHSVFSIASPLLTLGR